MPSDHREEEGEAAAKAKTALLDLTWSDTDDDENEKASSDSVMYVATTYSEEEEGESSDDSSDGNQHFLDSIDPHAITPIEAIAW